MTGVLSGIGYLILADYKRNPLMKKAVVRHADIQPILNYWWIRSSEGSLSSTDDYLSASSARNMLTKIGSKALGMPSKIAHTWSCDLVALAVARSVSPRIP
jgi:hypothetical protein